MKLNLKLITLAIILLIAEYSFAHTIKAKAQVNKAMVYLNGAQLYSSQNITLTQGENTIIFEGVSPQIQVNSLQASGKGNFIIMDVKYDAIYPEQTAITKPNAKAIKALKLLNDSVINMQFEIDELNERLAALNSEKNILLNNRLMKGETKRDTLAMFKDAMEYLRLKLNNITSESFKIKRELNTKNDFLSNLNERLNEQQDIMNQLGNLANAVQANHRVMVSVIADLPVAGSISINYFVANAGWTPEYDLRVDNSTGKILLTQKARLVQNTGVDWDNAELTLATGAPMQSTIKPNITPAYLSFYNAYKRDKATAEKKTLEQRPATLQSEFSGTATGSTEIDALSSMDFTSVIENMTQAEYEIKLKYSIPADGQEHLVAMQSKELKSEFNLSSVPKLDASAYLMAKITGWEELNLIAGRARIYFDGSYIGESYIDPNTTNDTLELSLGRDKGIAITRKRLKDKTKERILLEEKTISVSYEITVKNNKNKAVDLHIDDQIPLSTDPAIVIKLVESSKAKFNEETGLLEWNVNLKPKETRKISFTYEVKIPKDKAIAGL